MIFCNAATGPWARYGARPDRGFATVVDDAERIKGVRLMMKCLIKLDDLMQINAHKYYLSRKTQILFLIPKPGQQALYRNYALNFYFLFTKM